MRLAFVSVENGRSIRTWSGTTKHMMDGLVSAGVEVEVVGPLRRPGRNMLKAVGRAHDLFTSTIYDCDREPYLLAGYARQVKSALAKTGPVDAIVSPGSIAVSLLKVDTPVVIWTDATVGCLYGFYERVSRLSPRSLKTARDMERSALRNATLFVASSEWARAAAIGEYGIPAEKTRVISFGANLERINYPVAPDSKTLPSVAAVPLYVLIVGVNWVRKGVDTAIDTIGIVRDSGMDVRLDVVGCTAPSRHVPDYVKVHGFLDKHTRDGSQRIASLFGRAAAFLLPSLAECTPIVLCEAAAYGLPAIVPRIGGIDSLVRDNVTGVVLDAPTPQQYASAIRSLLMDPERYSSISMQSRREYVTRLNWSSATQSLIEAIDDVAGARRPIR